MNNQYNITNKEIEAGLRSVVTIVRHEGGHIPLHATKLMSVVQAHLGSNIELANLLDIDAETLASEIVDPWVRQQLVRMLIVSAMADMKPTKSQVKTIKSFAEALQVEELGIRALDLYVRGAHMRLRKHLAFNGHAVPQIFKAAKEESRWGILAVIARVIGLTENNELAHKYRSLLALPKGTLGRSYAEFIVHNNFGFPGEKGTPVEVLAIHDLCHILGGYGTDSASEIKAVAFQAGHLRYAAFNYLLVGLFQFHLGFNVSPVVGGDFGQLDIEAVFKALLKGARMNADLSNGGWNITEDLARPLSEVRAKYNITEEDTNSPTNLLLVA